MKPICQICGHAIIAGKAYYWNDDPKLSMHSDMKQCRKCTTQTEVNALSANAIDLAFADFLNRNVEYLNGRGEPVLIAKEC